MDKRNITPQMILFYEDFSNNMYRFLKSLPEFDGPVKFGSLKLLMYDPINGNIGSCIYPSVIVIFIGEIISMFSEQDLQNFKVFDGAVKSIITQTLIHEMLHTNRTPIMTEYNLDIQIHRNEEELIDRESVNIMMNRYEDIKSNFGFDLRIDIFTSAFPGPYKNNEYQKTPIEDYYIISIFNAFQNISMKDLKEFFRSYQTIEFIIRDTSCGFPVNNPKYPKLYRAFRIKQDGVYDTGKHMELFLQIMQNAVSEASKISYSVYVTGSDITSIGYLKIIITNREKYPMVFKD